MTSRDKLLLILLLLPTLGRAATIEGRVVQNDLPLAGLTVSAHATMDPTSPALAKAISDAEGRYRLELPDGHYALFARDAQRRLFAFCGRNPFEAAGKTPVWAGLQAVPMTPASYGPYDDPYSAAIEGTILFDGKPLAGAIVTLYLDTTDELKGQGYRLSLPTGADGGFAFDVLPEADYYLVARRRDHGGKVGPIRDGDDLALYAGNPLLARAGKSAKVVLHAVRKIKDATQDETFSRASGLLLRGTVVNADGQPASGLHVFAYTDKVIGHKRPEAISSPTAGDGAFAIAFPGPGLYYLGARENYGDSPAPGERFGLYDVSVDHGLKIGPEMKQAPIKIVVEPISLN